MWSYISENQEGNPEFQINSQVQLITSADTVYIAVIKVLCEYKISTKESLDIISYVSGTFLYI